MSETDNIKNTLKSMDFVFNRLDESPEERRERLDDARKEDKQFNKVKNSDDWDMKGSDYV